VDNFETDTSHETPRAEALVHLYELRDRIERVIAARGVQNPRSESERHLIEHGHRLSFGCCATVTPSPAKRRVSVSH
jgi:hypothetical protein